MSRDSILKAVRAGNQNSLEVPPSGARLAAPTETSRAELAATFIAKAESTGIVIERLSDLDAVPNAIVRRLRLAGIAPLIRHGSDPVLATILWDHQAPDLKRRHGAATGDDRASLSRARYGVSETGTLVLASGANNPVTLAFLPEVHFVLLHQADIVATLEQALAGIQTTENLPRTVNLISGASRTGDIGGQLVMGAHGPRLLIVLLISS